LSAPEQPQSTQSSGAQHSQDTSLETQSTHGGGAGRVYLVGAGPGDPGLLTAHALDAIARADTILYDRLIPTAALEGARADAELLFVGKEGGGESVPQEHTQALMVERARAGREVVRLKGGDPFVFGRGGEEALALHEAGIDFVVVPGVTAGVAAAAYAGIPVTHRGLSTGVALITGHTRESAPVEHLDTSGDETHSGEPPNNDSQARAGDGGSEEAVAELDWQALAAFPGTLVFYMGVRRLPHIAERLIAAGRSASQPVALVERGTLPDQRTVTGTLDTIAEVAHRERIKAPAITIVGAVAELAGSLEWLPARPLAGCTVVVTRARAQAGELARRLRELGANVVQTPAIRTRALPGPPLDPSPYDLICLASPNAVEHLFARIDDGVHPPGDARSLAHARVAAIGPATARALAKHGVIADVIPVRAHAESLLEALERMPLSRVLIPRARDAPDVLPDGLRAHGAQVDVVALYETLPEPLPAHLVGAARTADYVTFASSSAVSHFIDGLRGALDARGEPTAPDMLLPPHTRTVSIGPLTSATLREHGIEPHIEAERHDIDGLVDALLVDAASRGD
jgi:uroporphyrinogen III methyltransferase / synthase